MVTPILPLTVKGAVVKRRGKTLLGPIDLDLSSNGFTIVLGPNGAGKTTLLRVLHGLQKLSKGQLTWAAPIEETLARQAFVFQQPVMLRRSVRDNLAYPLIVQGVPKVEARAQADIWAERTGLVALRDRRAPRLSGGEKQKLALARALMRAPDILFLDEPCANLDGRATREIEAILKQAQTDGTRIVMTTHNIGQARRLASDILFLMDGCIIESGDAEAFFATPKTPQAAALLNGDIVE